MGRPRKEEDEPRDGRVMLHCGVCRQVTEHARHRGDPPDFKRCVEARVGTPAHGRTVEGDTESLPGVIVEAPTPAPLTSLVNRGVGLPIKAVVDRLAARRPYKRRTVAPSEETMPRPKKSSNLLREAITPIVRELVEETVKVAVEASVRAMLGLGDPATAEPKPKRKYTRRADKAAA